MAPFYLHQYSFRWSVAPLLRTVRRHLLLAFLLLAALAGLVANASLEALRAGLPDVRRLQSYQPSLTTRIFSSDGQLIGTLYRENRTWVPLEKMSPWLVKALIAVEDSRFFQHGGVDEIGVVRAFVADLRSGGSHQGASTITMQLARNLFLTRQRTMERKIREAMLAEEIEKRYSKKQILELYLNQVYFGSGAYGAQAAASVYFDRPASRLTPAQAALIAGMPQAPSELSPLIHPRAARARQELVLNRMLSMGSLTWDQYRAAMREARTMVFRKRAARHQLLKVPYFTSYVIRELSKRYSEQELYQGGLSIYTTVDLKLQKTAESAVRTLVGEDERALNVHQAALVTLDNRNGFVRAMVGGRGWTQRNQFNRAWQARRQAGSSFKPVVYTAALEAGMTPASLVDDTGVRFELGPNDVWEPKNSDGREMGRIPLWKALEQSRNIVSARLVAALTPEVVVAMAERMGIPGLTPTYSLALGTAEVSPLQMASVYSIFPNSGMRIEPVTVLRVVDAEGHVREDNRQARGQLVLTPVKARTMIWMMRRVVEHGTALLAQLPGYDVAGKTGTTDSSRDAWFVGYTTDYTTAVWTGNDDYTRMWGAYGGNLPARIFREVMTAAMAGKSARDLPWPSPATRVSVDVCGDTHQRAGPYCKSHYPVVFDATLVPTELCDKHREAPVLKGQVNDPAVHVQSPAQDLEFHPAPEPSASATPDGEPTEETFQEAEEESGGDQ